MICIPLSENEKLKDVLIVSTFMHDNFLGNNIILDNSTLTILKIAFKQVVNALYNLEANARGEGAPAVKYFTELLAEALGLK